MSNHYDQIDVCEEFGISTQSKLCIHDDDQDTAVLVIVGLWGYDEGQDIVAEACVCVYIENISKYSVFQWMCESGDNKVYL